MGEAQERGSAAGDTAVYAGLDHWAEVFRRESDFGVLRLTEMAHQPEGLVRRKADASTLTLEEPLRAAVTD